MHPVRQVRTCLGYSQPAFAKLVGCSAIAIQRIENGTLKLRGVRRCSCVPRWLETYPVCHRLTMFICEVAVNLADQNAAVAVSHPRRNGHEIHAGHDAHGNEVVPAIVEIEIRPLRLCSR